MSDARILIIDDDQDDVEILAEAFTESGVDNVHYVHSAMQAFMYLEEKKAENLPKLIVTDLYLPGISGEEFLRDLKAMEKYKNIHVIILSTIKSEKEIARYREMGAEDYLEKPVSYEDYIKVAADIKQKLHTY
jgi:CheY-like chemotaxis protein